MGKGKRYNQKYKDSVLDLYKSEMRLSEIVANMALQN